MRKSDRARDWKTQEKTLETDAVIKCDSSYIYRGALYNMYTYDINHFYFNYLKIYIYHDFIID